MKTIADHVVTLEMFIDDAANAQLADENETIDTTDAFQAFKALELEIVHLRRVLTECGKAFATTERDFGLILFDSVGRPIKTVIAEALLS